MGEDFWGVLFVNHPQSASVREPLIQIDLAIKRMIQQKSVKILREKES